MIYLEIGRQKRVFSRKIKHGEKRQDTRNVEATERRNEQRRSIEERVCKHGSKEEGSERNDNSTS